VALALVCMAAPLLRVQNVSIFGSIVGTALNPSP
jgi:hypothetical protein